MNSQNTRSYANVVARHLQKYLVTGILCLLAATGIISVSPSVIAQAPPAAAPRAPQPEKSEKKSVKPLHKVRDASREELLKVIDKQRKLINALEARVKELEESVKSADGRAQ